MRPAVKIFGPITAYTVFHLLALGVASVSTFLLMKMAVDRGRFVLYVPPRTERALTSALLVVALSLLVACVGDYPRNTLWLLASFTPLVLVFFRPFHWSIVGWWVLFVVITWSRCRSGAAALETFAAYHTWLGVRVEGGDRRVTCAVDASVLEPFGGGGR